VGTEVGPDVGPALTINPPTRLSFSTGVPVGADVGGLGGGLVGGLVGPPVGDVG
jgi:hypothetical protein